MKFLTNREPVLYLELFRSLVILLVSFGLSLTDGQQASLLLFASTLISVLARQNVTPTVGTNTPNR